MPRTCRPQTRSVRPSHMAITSSKPNSTPSPSSKGRKPGAVFTRVIVHAVNPVIGPDSGHAWRRRVCARLIVRRSAGCSSLAAWPIDRLDLAPLGCRQVGFGTSALVGWEGVGERPGRCLPDPALNSVLMLQCQANDAGEVSPETRVRKVRRWSGPMRREEVEPVPDQIAPASDDGLCPGDLRCGRLLV